MQRKVFATVIFAATEMVLSLSSTAQAQDVPDAQALAQWQDAITQTAAPVVAGCFQTTYPSLVWAPVECGTVDPAGPHPIPRVSGLGESQTTGNGHDYALGGGGLIKQTVGTFPTVSGITSEKSADGSGGILGANEYSLQLNTNANATSAACKGIKGCTVWQQFIYATDYATKGSAAVFMQYWLIGYGTGTCPSGFAKYSTDCYKNSAITSAPDVVITGTALESINLTASAVSGGNDSVTFTHGTKAYTVTAPDSVLDIATAWNESEFNVVGDAGGSEAVFDTSAAITVNVAATFSSSSSKAACEANSGTTGETNSLTLGTCTATGTAIKFHMTK